MEVYAGAEGCEEHEEAVGEEEALCALAENLRLLSSGALTAAPVIGQMWGRSAWRTDAAPAW